jgi:hypothetical protein
MKLPVHKSASTSAWMTFALWSRYDGHENSMLPDEARRPRGLAPLSGAVVSDRLEGAGNPGVVVRVSRRRIRIRVHLRGRERVVNIDPENILVSDEVD